MYLINRLFNQIFAVSEAFISRVFYTDSGLMSKEVSEILANPEDAKKYKEAIKKVEETHENVTITLSNNKTLTLVN